MYLCRCRSSSVSKSLMWAGMVDGHEAYRFVLSRNMAAAADVGGARRRYTMRSVRDSSQQRHPVGESQRCSLESRVDSREYLQKVRWSDRWLPVWFALFGSFGGHVRVVYFALGFTFQLSLASLNKQLGDC